MGLRDAWQAAKVEMGAVPVDIDDLGDDLRDCVERIHPKDRNSFLGGFNAWGSALKLQDGEVSLAASPVVMKDRGILIPMSKKGPTLPKKRVARQQPTSSQSLLPCATKA